LISKKAWKGRWSILVDDCGELKDSMRVLFVSSANKGISPIVLAQGRSMVEEGIDIVFFGVKGKGMFGYLRNAPILRREISLRNPQVIHAHFSLCGFVTVLAAMGKKKTIVVSLMGSDVKGAGLLMGIIRCFTRYLWDATIVKSDDMHSSLRVDSAEIIPNGINLGVFNPLLRNDCRAQLGWDSGKHYILFGADPDRDVKNYPLARHAFELLIEQNPTLTTENCRLATLGSVPHHHVAIYLNACDSLLLTSKWEGSPNIVKEAMACNTPIVSVDVGDVRWLLNGLEGCYVTSHDPEDIASKIKQALDFRDKTKGRERLIELGLDSESVARRIVNVYERLMKEREL